MYEDKEDNWTGPQKDGGINSAGSHTHSISLTAELGTHSHTISGGTGDNGLHSHPFEGITESTGLGQSFDNLPPYVDLIFAIKYTKKTVSVPVLKVKNKETGEWMGIESIQGATGPSGPKGDSGPYFTPSVSSFLHLS